MSIELQPPDLTYLHLDTPSRPMHWAMVLELEGVAPEFADIRARVADRIGLFDLFRLGIAGARWRRPQTFVAADVDVDAHVVDATYTDDRDLRAQIATLLETALDRSAPLWHVTVFTPQAGGALFVLLRVHHAVSDGIAGAAFAALLADGTPAELAEFERFATSPRFRSPEVDPAVLAESKAAFTEQWNGARKGRGWPKLTKGGRRDIALTSVSTRDLRRAAKRSGASVHEFLLAAVGRAVSLTPPTEGAGPDVIRVTLPVTNDPEFRHTGNAVVVTPLNLPGNVTDLARQVEKSRSELAIIGAKRPELISAAHESKLPWAAQRAIAGAALAHMSPDVHIGINPGFSQVRSVLGRPIAALTPLSPLAGYSFSVTSLILGKRTTFGVVTDPDAVAAGYAEKFVETFGGVLRDAVAAEEVEQP